ncbi:MAG: DotH/IcmK family type IV secretion protein [Alphaproteobacteria bacterium]|nr:DotH/IcmK family type IV secretion protein [Alphaproteobacteria bacterium]
MYKQGRKIAASVVLGAALTGLMTCAAVTAWAQTGPTAQAIPQDLLEALREGAPVPPPPSPPAEQAQNKENERGIELDSLPPLPEITAEQMLLERQAFEAAEAAREEEERIRKEEEHNRRSYKRATEGLFPLTPEQIRHFMERLEATQAVSEMPSGGQPQGEVKIVHLSLDPGGQPPTINLAAGYVTTIDLIDQTGEPWPIADVGVGGNFEVTPTEAGSHVVRVIPLTRVGTGNLSILLKGLSTPIIFRLSAGGPTFHMRFDASVPQLGPNAKTPLIKQRRGVVAGDVAMTMILENAPPDGAQRLRVGGLDARTMAWQLGGRVYVRTPLTLLSPAWNASASSADGMTVYEIGDAPVLLVSDNGAMIRARLMRDENDVK